jgi:plastocyanin
MLSRSLPARLLAVVAALAAALVASASASAEALPGAHVSQTITPSATYPGLQHLHYEFGPVAITPGQNTIEAQNNTKRPDVPGYIVRFKPDLVCAGTDSTCGKDHSTPRVDVIHLHHGVWLNNFYPTFAAGEEKTVFNFPQGYGYHYKPSDSWIMNYMIHNLTPNQTAVYITYDIDFVPDSAPAAQSITPVKPLWMDVSGLKPYPVFDAYKGSGTKGKFTFPDQAKGAQKKNIGVAHEWNVPSDVTLVGVAGHLHPGGLWNDLKATRGGTTKELFRSVAKYWEPAGAVSWDVAMTASKPDWRVALHQGDKLNISVTYDTKKASWYESMGIMVVFYADGIAPDAKDPFSQGVDTAGWLTHGHLPENDNHGGVQPLGLPDARKLLDGSSPSNVDIKGFVYGQGDLGLTGSKGRPPVVRAGRSLRFTNLDATKTMTPQGSAYHTITACRAPCDRDTGIAYPLANGSVRFDSGELGYGPYLPIQGFGGKFTPAKGTNVWKTPKTLKAGTYTYFCRIHPFMRGAFRVVGKNGKGSVTKKHRK